MNAEDTGSWKFSMAGEKVIAFDLSDVRCNECMEFSPISEWIEGSVGCDDCGDHSTMECPKCGYEEDHVYQFIPMEMRISDATKIK